jgi:hypothetical protein
MKIVGSYQWLSQILSIDIRRAFIEYYTQTTIMAGKDGLTTIYVVRIIESITYLIISVNNIGLRVQILSPVLQTLNSI